MSRVYSCDASEAFKNVLEKIVESKFDMSINWQETFDKELNRIAMENCI